MLNKDHGGKMEEIVEKVMETLDVIRMTATATWPTHVLNLTVFCQQLIKLLRAAYNCNKDEK